MVLTTALLGAFETFYIQTYLPHSSSSAISWIGSIEAFLLLMGEIPAGSRYDRGQLRGLVLTTTFLVVFRMMMKQRPTGRSPSLKV